MKERLQKFLAHAGVASRRKAEELIAAGLVTVNGAVVKRLGTTVDPNRDQVTIKGKPIASQPTRWYVALNKPVGVVSSKVAQRGERTVYQLVPESGLFAIAGRLDKDSEGLVLLTNDGDLVQRLTHPKFQHEKEYLIETIKPLDAAMLNKLKRGVRLTEGAARADRVEHLHGLTYRLIIHQGWHQQIRRMIGAVRNDVVKLQRTRIAKLKLSNLRPGQWREVRRQEII